MSETDSTRSEGSRSLPPPPEPERAAASPPRRLYRDPRGPLGGVASGLAGYFEIDPVIVRLLWIVALLTGIGLPAYLVCWVVIPKARAWPPAGYADRVGGDSRKATLSSGLVVVALAALIGKGVHGLGDLLLPAALIGVGVYLLNQRAQRPLAAAQTGAGSAASAAETEGLPPLADFSEPPRSAAPIGLVTPTVLSLFAIGAGACWGLHAAGVVHFSVVSVAAGGLILVGAGLIASLWLGRAPGLIVAGLGLIGVMLTAAALEPLVERARALDAGTFPQLPIHRLGRMGNSMGDRRYEPLTLADLQPRYELGVGELTLDLTRIDFTETTRDLQLNVGMGKALVIVPSGTEVEVVGQVGLGEATAFDQHDEGVGNKLEAHDIGSGSGKLRIQFDVGIGEGTVRRGL